MNKKTLRNINKLLKPMGVKLEFGKVNLSKLKSIQPFWGDEKIDITEGVDVVYSPKITNNDIKNAKKKICKQCDDINKVFNLK